MKLAKLKQLLEANQQRTATAPNEDEAVKKPAGKKDTTPAASDGNPNKDLPPVKGKKTMTGQQSNTVDVEPGLYPKEVKESITQMLDEAIAAGAPSAELIQRSRSIAKKFARKRLANKNPEGVDDRLLRHQTYVDKLAVKLLPRVSRTEMTKRLMARRNGSDVVSESDLSELLNFLPEAEQDYALSEKEIEALQEKAAARGTTFEILETVFRRGIAMWEDIETDMTFSQYAFGRVNSFLNRGKARDLDFDLVVEDCENYASKEVTKFAKDREIDLKDRREVDDREEEKQVVTGNVKGGFHRHHRDSVKHRTTDKPGRMKYAEIIRKITNPDESGEVAEELTMAQRMRRLMEFKKEDVPNLEDGMDKRRCDMPQLTNFDAFHKDLTDAGHQLGHDYVKPDTLTPTQKHFNQEKVDKLKKDGWGDKGIIVSNDNYVIDGHHRWLAAHQKGEKIKARRTSLDCEKLLDFVKGKPYVEKKNLDESERFTDEHGIEWNDEGMGRDVHGNEYEFRNGKKIRVSSAFQKGKSHSNPYKLKFHHDVPFHKKDEAKAEGMRWDPDRKKWYHGDAGKSVKSKFPRTK